jgi:anaerobic selenocysteine-containing dehydrogenase
VEKITGVSADRIQRLAQELSQHAPAVALIGAPPLALTNGMFHALAVNALNAVLGSVGQQGGIQFMPEVPGTPRPQQRTSMQKWTADILGGASSPVQLLMLYEANPVFATPPSWKVKDALNKIPYIVSFGNFFDETSSLADLILPDHSFLESWVDHAPESGATVAVASVAGPAMHPLHNTRSMPDVLLEVSRSLSKPIAPALPQTYQDMLQAAFATLPAAKPKSADEPAADVWSAAQQKGGWWGEVSGKNETAAPTASSSKALAYTEPQFDGATNLYPFNFLPYASQQFLDGSAAHLPWLQELPDVMTTAMWTSWVEINPKTAEKLGIVQGDLVEVTSSQGAVRSPAVISPVLLRI